MFGTHRLVKASSDPTLVAVRTPSSCSMQSPSAIVGVATTTNRLEGLPPELFEQIAGYVTGSDLKALRLVSRECCKKSASVADAVLYSRLAIMMWSESSLRVALGRVRNPYLGPRIREIIIYDNILRSPYYMPRRVSSSVQRAWTAAQRRLNLHESACLLQQVFEVFAGSRRPKSSVVRVRDCWQDQRLLDNIGLWVPLLPIDCWVKGMCRMNWEDVPLEYGPGEHDSLLRHVLECMVNRMDAMSIFEAPSATEDIGERLDRLRS